MTKKSLEKEILKASSLVRKGEINAAANIYKDILKRFPNNKRARTAFGKIRKKISASEPESLLLKKSIQELSALQRDGKKSEAFQRSIALSKKFSSSYIIHNFLGIFAAQTQNFSESENAFREAIRLKPNYADSHNNLGNVLKAQGKLTEAKRCFNCALKIYYCILL